jgi:hypothetical protein
MMRLLRRGALALALGLVLALLGMQTGCGGIKKAPVSGRVTFRGKAVKSGKVIFLGPHGYSMGSDLDGDGRYQLQAAVGENTVTVESRGVGTPVTKLSGPEGGPGYVKTAPGKLLIPERYISPTHSGLKFNVQSGQNTADFALTD